MSKPTIAVLDDYQKVALQMADWSAVQKKADVTIFSDNITQPDALVERLMPFDVVCVMRERTPLKRDILARLPNLRLIVSTGFRNASIDMEAATELGIKIANTGYLPTGAPELTWGLLLAIARHIPQENLAFKSGKWQQTIGTDLSGKTIGIIGLGRIGSTMSRYAKAFDMNIIAWSEHLTEEKARSSNAKLVSKEELFREADFVTVHLVLSSRSRGIIGVNELGWMKPTAYLVNTSRGPLIDEAALIDVLQNRRIAGAAIDVFDQEPLPVDHPFRTLDNVLCTPHIGFVTTNTYQLFYGDMVKALLEWLLKSGS